LQNTERLDGLDRSQYLLFQIEIENSFLNWTVQMTNPNLVTTPDFLVAGLSLSPLLSDIRGNCNNDAIWWIVGDL
jgi:hypothetical protein